MPNMVVVILLQLGAGLALLSHTLARAIPEYASASFLEERAGGVPSTASLNSGVRFLYQNDLDWQRAADSSRRQPGYLLLTTPQSSKSAANDCNSLSEKLLGPNLPLEDGLQKQLDYLQYDGSYGLGQAFWVAGTKALVYNPGGKVTIESRDAKTPLPALCTQSAVWKNANSTDTSADWQISTQVGKLAWTGYRDQLSFRFLSFPYADQTQRFDYSSVYSGTGTIKALRTGRAQQCPQASGTDQPWTESCLVMDVFTPYLPSPSDQNAGKGLKPIMLWIHGGGFSSGSGLDITFDGGQLASRSDVVIVTPNYRLGSLGFLAVDDQVKGNFGFADIITALQWIQKYARAFGGDPNNVTIFGQSAGAQVVEGLLGSPAAAGLFKGAIIQSGRPMDQTNALQTTAQAGGSKGGEVLQALGCSGASDVLACLRGLSANKFISNTQFTKLVVDGTYITRPTVDLRSPGLASGHVNRVPVIMGFMRDEQAALGTVPPLSQQSLDAALRSAGVSAADRQTVESDPSVFAVSAAQNGVQNLTVTVETDIMGIARCGQESTIYTAASNGVFPAIYSYTMDRRSYQIPNYDPYGVCNPKGGADYYHCHSGDLMPVFNTLGQFALPYRDAQDLPWMASIADQWTAFARYGNPVPPADYLRVRGYASTADRVGGDAQWTPTTGTQQTILALGPRQFTEDLAQYGEQCDALGKGLDYVANEQ